MKLELNYQELYPKIIEKFRESLSRISNTGQLANSVTANEAGDDDLKITFLEYGIFVDSGRAPGKFPPVKPIEEWAVSKGIPANKAFAIARSIEQKGIRPRPFIQPTLDDILDNMLIPEIEEQVADQIETQIVESLPKEINIKI